MRMGSAMHTAADTLLSLQKRMFEHYTAYRDRKISQQEYLVKIKPIDGAIEKIELSALARFSCKKLAGT
jgi:hypothetical protein